jgi:hypothetical protein
MVDKSRTNKPGINLNHVLIDETGANLVSERKYKFGQDGKPVIKDGQPEVLSEKFLDVRSAIIKLVNHYEKEDSLDFGEIVKRGQLVNRLRDEKLKEIELSTKWIELIKKNLVRLDFTPFVCVQIASIIEGKTTEELLQD